MYTFQYNPALHIWFIFISFTISTVKLFQSETKKKLEAKCLEAFVFVPLCLNLTVVLWFDLLLHSKQDLGFNLSPNLFQWGVRIVFTGCGVPSAPFDPSHSPNNTELNWKLPVCECDCLCVSGL